MKNRKPLRFSKTMQVYNVFIDDKDFGEMEFGVFDNVGMLVKEMKKTTKRRLSDKKYVIKYSADYEDQTKNTVQSLTLPISNIEELQNGDTVNIKVYYREINAEGNYKNYNYFRIKKVTLNKVF
uniref:Uncharacterized protein n=1 Tax=viral metagenome TaxID=1070528 RepID=A0A6C0JS02_9ZZZZ